MDSPTGMDRSADDGDPAERWQRLTAQQLRDGAPQLDLAASWRGIEARIGAAPRRVGTPGAPAWWRHWSRYLVGYGLGAAAAAAVTWWLAPPPRTFSEVAPLGAPAMPAAADRRVVDVVFRDDADMRAMREALRDAGAGVIGGPSALGLWRVALPNEGADLALRRLRQHPAVESVSEAP